MTTYLDIIDTSVKIGLGAFISATTTYLIARMNYTKAVSKELLDEKRKLLISGIEKVNESASISDPAYVGLTNKRESFDDKKHIAEEVAMLWESCGKTRDARNLFLILGDDELIESCTEFLNAQRDLAVSVVGSERYQSIVTRTKEIDKKRLLLGKQYSKALERIYT